MRRSTAILFGLSLLLNALVVGGLLFGWTFRTDLYRSFLHPIVTEGRLGWFAAFPVTEASTVFLGDSITQQASWSEMFPGIETRNRGIGAIVLMAYVRAGSQGQGGSRARAMIRQGYRRGRAADWLPALDWEALLERPLDEVRQTLSVGEIPSYTEVRSEGAPALA